MGLTLTRNPTRPGQNRWPGDPWPVTRDPWPGYPVPSLPDGTQQCTSMVERNSGTSEFPQTDRHTTCSISRTVGRLILSVGLLQHLPPIQVYFNIKPYLYDFTTGWVSEQFLNGTSAHYRLFSAINGYHRRKRSSLAAPRFLARRFIRYGITNDKLQQLFVLRPLQVDLGCITQFKCWCSKSKNVFKFALELYCRSAQFNTVFYHV